MVKEKRNKGGRPRKPPEMRLVRVTGCISPMVCADLMKLAVKEGLDQSGVVRAACEQFVQTRILRLPDSLAAAANPLGTE